MMWRAGRLFLAATTLVACGNTPPVPDWQMSAKGALERAQQAYLVGNSRVELAEFAKARAEVASTGRVDLLARLELSRCATRVASLVLEECAGYHMLVADAPAPERAYAAYLRGRGTPQEAALLPQQHRAVAGAPAGAAAPDLTGIADPLDRLVAAAVLLQTGRADPSTLGVAVDTASAQGWRRPLLAWLGVQAQRAQQAGDTEQASRIRRRIDLVGELR